MKNSYPIKYLSLLFFATLFFPSLSFSGPMAKRFLPTETYTPNTTVIVELEIVPEGLSAIAVEESFPPGWKIEVVNDGGVGNEAESSVRWFYFGSEPKTLTYHVTPPLDATGSVSFFGKVSFNGPEIPIAGDTFLSGPDGNLAPYLLTVVDGSGGGFFEAGATAQIIADAPPSADKEFDRWTGAVVSNPNFRSTTLIMPAAATTVTATYKNRVDPVPMDVALRDLPEFYTPGVSVTVHLSLLLGIVQAGEEIIPSGWTVANISHGGIWNQEEGVVRWGMFSDRQQRTLTYETTPPLDAQGVAIFSGMLISEGGAEFVIGGDTSLDPSPFLVDPPETTYALTVIDGGGNGDYAEGTTVTITANPASEGWVFDQWIGATVSNRFAETTTFTMPAADIIIEATYKIVGTNDIFELGSFRNILYPLRKKFLIIPTPSSIADWVKVTVINSSGKIIRELDYENGAFSWDCRNDSQTLVASGTYVLLINDQKQSQTKKVVVIK